VTRVGAGPVAAAAASARGPLLEAVPNFSEGRDPALLAAIVAAARDAGADVLDWCADVDHHRAVVTIVGTPAAVEDAAVAAARVAVERIDLRRHEGVHPRVGAIDVLPFVPLPGLTLQDARASARRVGARIAKDVGVPILYYGEASDPPGRALAELRRGGFEALVGGWPSDRVPDVLPPAWPYAGAHPTAGAVCVGARKLLLAWNVYIEGVTLAAARAVARSIRARDGGPAGVRALARELPRQGRMQISMNIEDLDATSPMAVFERIEARVGAAGGRVVETEVIGMVPTRLTAEAAADRLRLAAGTTDRLLAERLVEHMMGTRAAESGGVARQNPGMDR
jgi:glutamate formiminotransferase